MFKLPIAAVAAAVALASCNGSSSNTVAPVDPMAENMATPATPVELPPAVRSSKSYRCADNSVVHVDLFQGGKQADLRDGTDGPTTTLRAANEGEPLVAEGFELTEAGNVLTVTRPGRAKQACKG